MKKLLLAVLGTVMAFSCMSANADHGKSKQTDIKVMTQNQYLGADLGPVIAATPAQYPYAIVNARRWCPAMMPVQPFPVPSTIISL
jgi:hypothetical protein